MHKRAKGGVAYGSSQEEDIQVKKGYEKGAEYEKNSARVIDLPTMP